VLEEKDFDNLFTVRPKSYVGRYDWWKEDKSITDDEIKLF